MSWFRVDDTFVDHPKVIELQTMRQGKGSLALWLLAGSWCSKHLTDGHVPAGVVPRLGATKAEADALVAVGLWVVEDGGYRFHEWTDRNPPRDEVEAKRAMNRDRVARYRERQSGNASQAEGSNALQAHDASDPVMPLPSRPDPTHPISGEREPLTLVRGLVVGDGITLRDFVRSGVIKGYEHLKLPPPRETRDLTWRGWHELEHWTVSKASLLGWDQRETARHLIRCFLRSATARKKGHPIKFLVENANEYWRDELPAEVA